MISDATSKPPPPPSVQRYTGARLLVAGLAMSAIAMLLARVPGVVEGAYASGIGPAIARALSRLTGFAPVSIGALTLVALGVWLASSGARGLILIRSGSSTWRAASIRGANRLAGIVGALLLLFYPLWGFNYARAPLDARLGMDDLEAVDPVHLRRLTDRVARETGRAYRVLHGGVADAGNPTTRTASVAEISHALEIGWRRAGGALGMSPTAKQRYGPAKSLGVTHVLDFLGVVGVYLPFTGEAHVSSAQPALSLPAVVAHEQAHQRGIARENEASFVGAVVAIHSEDPLLRYSGWARILRALQRDLVRTDRGAWAEIRGSLEPGVIRDWQHYLEWLRDSRSAAAPLVEATNDAYLRAHAVPGGIESYNRVATLLLKWDTRYGGLMLP